MFERSEKYGDPEFERLPEIKKYRKIMKNLDMAEKCLVILFYCVFIINIIAVQMTHQKYNEKTAAYFIDKYNTIFWVFFAVYLAILSTIFIVKLILGKKYLSNVDRFYASKMNISVEDLHDIDDFINELYNPKLEKLSNEEFEKKANAIVEKYKNRKENREKETDTAGEKKS